MKHNQSHDYTYLQSQQKERFTQVCRVYGTRRPAGATGFLILTDWFAWLIQTKTYPIMKRAMDILASSLLLLAAMPVIAFLAAAIKLCDGGPILFFQYRVGRRGRVFRFPKFRSMVVNAEKIKAELAERNQHGESITFKLKTDPRITPVGRWMRRLSLDELPQLWCVLAGDMALVGPRPPLPDECSRYTLEDRRRLDVTPGLTCIWQVSGRGDVPFHIQVKQDIDYIERQSLREDIRLLLLTVPAVLKGRGAY
jgi:lipopolysaccharide/colanic/teichoic acid biosynthesis glycosyltransferase